MNTTIQTRTEEALELVTDIYSESGKDWASLQAAAEAEQARYGVGAEESDAVEALNDAHVALAEKISDALGSVDITAGGPFYQAGLFSIGNEDIYGACEIRGVYGFDKVMYAIEVAIRTVIEDQVAEEEALEALSAEEAREAEAEAEEANA